MFATRAIEPESKWWEVELSVDVKFSHQIYKVNEGETNLRSSRFVNIAVTDGTTLFHRCDSAMQYLEQSFWGRGHFAPAAAKVDDKDKFIIFSTVARWSVSFFSCFYYWSIACVCVCVCCRSRSWATTYSTASYISTITSNFKKIYFANQLPQTPLNVQQKHT